MVNNYITLYVFMIKDEDVIFLTTSLYTKWLRYQSNIINNIFPKSQHIIIDGRNDWPYVWFYWIAILKNIRAKWLVHLDEDCFLMGRNQLIELISKMEHNDYTLSAVSDAYHQYRRYNPVAVNPFFMVGNVAHFLEIGPELDNIEFDFDGTGWRNNKGVYYNPDRHRVGFVYPHRKINQRENCLVEKEPYYLILWLLKEKNRKFNYLYPHFDDRFKSTNPRISETSADIAIHMWYIRYWDSTMDVHGIPNRERYSKLENYLVDNI